LPIPPLLVSAEAKYPFQGATHGQPPNSRASRQNAILAFTAKEFENDDEEEDDSRERKPVSAGNELFFANLIISRFFK
jgi:hypothetical protein